MTRKTLRRALVSLALAGAFTAAAGVGVFYYPDNLLADRLYQSPEPLDANVFVVGIDERAIDELGPYQSWERDVIATALESLNADPENRPAAIGVDVLYIGETDPSFDEWLAEAAGAFGNVVTASAATFGTELVTAEGSFYLDDYAILAYEEPFEALRSVTTQGHINAMYDSDGVLRHSILKLELPDGREIPSFAYALYEKYAAAHGLDPTLEIPTDDRHRFWVDYAALPGGFYEGISVADLISGDFPAELFRDAVVIIGPYAAGLSDYVTTAVDRAELMYGPEFQANVTSQLIRGDFKYEVSEGLQLFLLFLVSALSLWVFLSCKLRVSTLLWLILGGGSIALSKLLYELGYVVYPLRLALILTLLYIGAVGVGYVREALEKRRISSTFRRYVAPEIVSELLRDGTDSLGLGGKLCDIAVLFVDIRGFTTMSEILTPEEVVSILNKYLNLTTACVMKNRGTLDKFVGDCTMAIWNAPVEQEDYVMNACKAALDMVEGSKALSEELLARFGRTVSFGIGVHCGDAVVGNIGAQMRMDYTAIGDTVNTAARLEANAPAGTIYISREVVSRLEGRLKVTSLGDGITLKGKSNKFEIFLLDGVVE